MGQTPLQQRRGVRLDWSDRKSLTRLLEVSNLFFGMNSEFLHSSNPLSDHNCFRKPALRSFKFILLPLAGVIAALAAFLLAAPFENTLIRPNGAESDPTALFTYGTAWGAVNRIAFGAILCGLFALVLTLGRRSLPRAVLAAVLGIVAGGAINFATDSGADVLGILISSESAQLGSLIAMVAWCLVVPIGIALAVTVSIGYTRERMRRAIYAARLAAIVSFAIQIVGGVMSAPDLRSPNVMLSQVPVWRMVEIGVGLTLGLAMLIADETIRVATVRRVHGRNEFQDWSIDHPITRIGAAEGCEIPIFGTTGIAPIHAEIVRQNGQFLLVAHASTQLNGLAIQQHLLSSGDHITIGSVEFIFKASTRQPSAATPQRFIPMVPVSVHILADSFGQTVPLGPGRYGVGTDRTNAICLYTDSTVAPNQAVIVVSDQGMELVGLAGTTKVNGQVITGMVSLKIGDTLEFGATQFIVRS